MSNEMEDNNYTKNAEEEKLVDTDLNEHEIELEDNEESEEESYSESIDRSRSASVETCIRNEEHTVVSNEIKTNEKTYEAVDKNEKKVVDPEINETELKVVGPNTFKLFSRGAIVGLFAATPLSTCIGFEIKEASGPLNGYIGAFLGATASALIGGFVAAYFATNDTTQKKSEPIEKIENETGDDELVKKTSSKTELNEEDIQFIMANTDFNRENVLRWFQTFKTECPDCQLDRKNFITFYIKLIPGQSDVKTEFADAVFEAFDQDNNGFVDFGEFLIAFWIKAKGDVEKKLVWLFEVYDNDRSGYISMTELTHMLRLLFSLKNMNDDAIERAKYVMDLVDINSDGELSKTEFVEGCLMDGELRKLLET